MIDLPIGKALVAVEYGEKESMCEGCFFHNLSTCENYKCLAPERKDGKQVHYKLVDMPEVKNESTTDC